MPGLATHLTYSDNVALAPAGAEQGRAVWNIGPSLLVSGESAHASMTAQARLDFFHYAGQAQGSRRRVATLSAHGAAELLPDWMYVEGSAAVSQQPVSAFGQGPGAPAYSAANRAELRAWRWSPYLRHRFGPALDLLLRYAHDEVSGNADGFAYSRRDSADLAAGGTTSLWRLHWNLAGHRDALTDDLAGTSSTEQAQAGMRLNLAPALSIGIAGGYDRYDFASAGGATRGALRSIGVGWQPGARTSVDATIGRRFFGRADSLAIQHRSRRTAWNIGYHADVTTMRSQFVLPAALDTAQLIDQLFRTMFPDPAERARAVADYMARSGLPPTLNDSVSYLSNRYTLQRQWQAAVALRAARTQMLVVLTQARHHALSAFEADSRLLGTAFGRMHDETRQRGAQIHIHGSVDSRTSWNAVFGAFRAASVADGVATGSTSVRVGVSRQFGRELQGSMELRRTQGSLVGAQRYRENALTLGVRAQF